ncbi:MAG: hypothetical protein H6718_13845 [Polyangiaceae bacterium]|nr:hypothetical protein [Myxococcales bacterium]MCB9586480.1 hypothetical protein [Polyangiaceae bacterium]MCB9605987.1 hypothetical protein [Polyangiaceae bacterium]
MQQQAIETTQTTEAPRLARLRALHASRLAFEAESRSLKRRLRAPWQEPMADAQRRLHQLRQSLTEIYCVLAFTRGRVHRRTEPTCWLGVPWEGKWDALDYAKRVTARFAPELLSEVQS